MNISIENEADKIEQLVVQFDELKAIQNAHKRYISELQKNIETLQEQLTKTSLDLNNKLGPVRQLVQSQLENSHQNTVQQYVQKYFLDLPTRVIQYQNNYSKNIQNYAVNVFFSYLRGFQNMVDCQEEAKKQVIESLQKKYYEFKKSQKQYFYQKQKLEKALGNLNYYDQQRKQSQVDVNLLYNKSYNENVQQNIQQSIAECQKQDQELKNKTNITNSLIINFDNSYVQAQETFKDCIQQSKEYTEQFVSQFMERSKVMLANVNSNLNDVIELIKQLNNQEINLMQECLLENILNSKSNQIDLSRYLKLYQQQQFSCLDRTDHEYLSDSFHQYCYCLQDIYQKKQLILKSAYSFFSSNLSCHDNMYKAFLKNDKNYQESQKQKKIGLCSFDGDLVEVHCKIQKVFYNQAAYMKRRQQQFEEISQDFVQKMKVVFENIEKIIGSVTNHQTSFIKCNKQTIQYI